MGKKVKEPEESRCREQRKGKWTETRRKNWRVEGSGGYQQHRTQVYTLTKLRRPRKVRAGEQRTRWAPDASYSQIQSYLFLFLPLLLWLLSAFDSSTLKNYSLQLNFLHLSVGFHLSFSYCIYSLLSLKLLIQFVGLTQCFEKIISTNEVATNQGFWFRIILIITKMKMRFLKIILLFYYLIRNILKFIFLIF